MPFETELCVSRGQTSQ